MSTITTQQDRRTFVARTPLWAVCIGAVLAGAVVTTGFEFLVRAFGVGLAAASRPGAEVVAIPEGSFFGGVVFWGGIGIVLALVLARFARRPRRTWLRTAWTLTVLSLVMPLVVAADSFTTNLTLAASHVVAAAVIVPMIGARMRSDSLRRR